MPNFDRTGPRGRGPMTGRRAGYCADVLPVAGYGWRRGRGRRRIFGFGRADGWEPPEAAELADVLAAEAPLSPDEQRRTLKAERNRLKTALGEVEAALRRLGAPSTESDAADS